MIFPDREWTRCPADEVGMSESMIGEVREWILREAGDAPHSAVIVRYGRLVAEWYKDMTADKQHPMASVCKSVFCSMLGIAVAEGRFARSGVGVWPVPGFSMGCQLVKTNP